MYEIDPNGGLLVKDCPNRWGSTIHTTEPDSANGKGFHGTVFSIGSGVYFESKIAMMNPKKIWNNAWPAFWSTDMKLDTGMHKEMAGNPGKYEYIEDDFMEYNPVWRNGCAYNSTVHDWHGITGGTGATLDVNNGNAVVPCPVGTDFTQPHTYGVLWVPATAKNGWIGYREAFFDGVPEGAVCYRGNQAGTYPPSGSYAFSLKDHDQFEVILGASHGGTPTMKVDYVHVYAVDPSSVTVVPAGQAAAASPPGH